MGKGYTLGLYEKSMPAGLSWKEMLETAKGSGYDFLEISIDETEEKIARLDMSEAERLQMVSLMKIVGLPIRTMCLSGHRKYPLGSLDPSIRAMGLNMMEKAIRLADDFGIRIIQLAGYDVYYEDSCEETRKYFIDNLHKAADMAAVAGVILGFETMETEFMNTVEKTMSFVREMSSMYLSIYPDIGNITNAAKTYGTDVLADLRTGRGHLVAMHLKETIPGHFREVPFGQGHVDFENAIKTAWELGVRKFVTEFWYTGSQYWREDLVHANLMMTEILERQQHEKGLGS